MLKLDKGMVLYHASYCDIIRPDLEKCAPYKDFGRGFYLSSSYEQAEKFIGTSLKKAKAQGLIDSQQEYGVISKFRVNDLNGINIKLYNDADSDWLHCVVAHRKEKLFLSEKMELEDYDIVVGKIADDATNFTILAYMAGTYGEVGSLEADTACIAKLLPERLDWQFCFKTQKALECLSFIESEKVCKK